VKKPITPKSRIRSAIRKLFMTSRERAAVLKAANYSCECCGVKKSVAKGKEVKVEVHHRSGIDNWRTIIESVQAQVLNADDMEVLCEGCHDTRHGKNI
jgi:hypothetical protein